MAYQVESNNVTSEGDSDKDDSWSYVSENSSLLPLRNGEDGFLQHRHKRKPNDEDSIDCGSKQSSLSSLKITEEGASMVKTPRPKSKKIRPFGKRRRKYIRRQELTNSKNGDSSSDEQGTDMCGKYDASVRTATVEKLCEGKDHIRNLNQVFNNSYSVVEEAGKMGREKLVESADELRSPARKTCLQNYTTDCAYSTGCITRMMSDILSHVELCSDATNQSMCSYCKLAALSAQDCDKSSPGSVSGYSRESARNSDHVGYTSLKQKVPASLQDCEFILVANSMDDLRELEKKFRQIEPKTVKKGRTKKVVSAEIRSYIKVTII